MMATQATQLNVFDGDAHVGTIHDTDPISFEYTPEWLNFADRYPVATIALQGGRNDSPAVHAFFENLLPEGGLRDALAMEQKVSSVFSLLRAVAGDNIGNLVLLPAGELPQAPTYMPTSWEEIAKVFAGLAPEGGSDRAGHRISVSGAQRKTTISLTETGGPQWPIGTAPSLYLVKPDIKSLDGVWSSAANETIVMRAAKHCGLEVAEVFYEPVTKSCVVKRFDRTLSASRIKRLVQYDFCQLSSTRSDKKYEHEGGPGIKSCIDIIKKNSARPAPDLKRFFEWLFFNLMVGNNDSHAKNLSLYQLAGDGNRLTPHYDLMCTRLYPGLSKEFALRVGDKTMPGEIGSEQVSALAAELGMKSSYLTDIADSVYKRLLPAMEKAIDELMPAFGPSEITLAKRLSLKVTTIAQSFHQRMTEMEN
jgi:serine/threonine-protein kinase HipA